MPEDPEIARWVIQEDPRLTSLLPYLLLGSLVVVGAVLAGVKAAFGVGDRPLYAAGLGVAGVLVAGILFLALGPKGEVVLQGGALLVDRPFRPDFRLPTEGLELERRAWPARTMTGWYASGLQVGLSAGGRTLWVGGAGERIAEVTGETSIPERTGSPHVVLSEEDLIAFLRALEGR